MILALGSLGVVAALNWQPLTLLIDTLLHWPNISMGLSQVALIACAAGSCVMITTVSSLRSPAAARKLAMVQYGVAALIAAVSLAVFFAAGREPEMAPQEYLRRSLGSDGTSIPWLLPLLYVMLALSLVAWAGLRHSNRTRRGRALFVFTVGIVLIVAALAFFLLRAVGTSGLVGVGAAATLLGCAMLIVAAGSLLPSLEDWFGARRELRTIQPLLTELGRRHPDVGIGVRPRGPLVFRVAERMSLISDALFLEATAAAGAWQRVDGRGGGADVSEAETDDEDHVTEDAAPDVSPVEQARAIAAWIANGEEFPGLPWLRQPATYSDREWILEIAEQYRAVDSGRSRGGLRRSDPPE
ncbi:hypothetical protein MPSYJ_12050 [Mycolicibacterium psychrotolerans]|uniref:Uncharacterized protein n=2 Tax=Mycolicibacterium psychrotolerans TaxID=216929 RepID=A0A7I7M6D9_9MYCO|nr:hypothetical protein MPSYJ_12050 [Mycolicibacterium psychrotolerans]